MAYTAKLYFFSYFSPATIDSKYLFVGLAKAFVVIWFINISNDIAVLDLAFTSLNLVSKLSNVIKVFSEGRFYIRYDNDICSWTYIQLMAVSKNKSPFFKNKIQVFDPCYWYLPEIPGQPSYQNTQKHKKLPFVILRHLTSFNLAIGMYKLFMA